MSVLSIIRQGRESVVEATRRLDSWVNTLSGIGTSRDKTTWMQPGRVELLSPMALEVMYATDDIATGIVRDIVDECYREEWTITRTDKPEGQDPGEAHGDAAPAGAGGGDDDPKEDDAVALSTRMKELEGWRKLKEARIWGRLYGKGAILLGANDGVPQERWYEPLDESRVTSFDFLTVLDRRDLTPQSWYADLEDEKFGQIATYFVQPTGVYMGQPYMGNETNPPILVHETRLLIFGGELTNKRQKLANQGCDYSVLQKCYRALQLTNNNWQSASTLLADAGQGVFKIRGLVDMIAQNPELMQSRMQLVDMMRSTVRAIVLDAGDERSKTPPEEFTRVATPFTGIPEMLRETWNRLACAAKEPLWKLMGSTPGGLNGAKEEEQDDWYNRVEGEQRGIDQPAIERILRLMALGMGIEGQWTAVPGTLRRMGQAQQAKAMSDLSVWAKNIVESGVMMPEEVAMSLAKDPSGRTLLINTEARKALMKASVDAAHAEREMAVKEAKAPIVQPGAKPGAAAGGAAPKKA